MKRYGGILFVLLVLMLFAALEVLFPGIRPDGVTRGDVDIAFAIYFVGVIVVGILIERKTP